MNCDDFGTRIHECLDRRQLPETDHQLLRHASECDSCRMQLEAWRQIGSVLMSGLDRSATPSKILGPRYRRRMMVATGVAAMCLFTVTALLYQRIARDTSQPVVIVDHDSLFSPDPSIARSVAEVDPARWWRGVQDQDWIGQTMPAVKSVQEGVAPLGRSLMRAVTILTIGGSDQTS